MVNSDMNNNSFFTSGEASAVVTHPFREDEFRQLLTLERKRSERSHKPLLLLMVDVSALTGEQENSGELAEFLQELAGLIRDIDQCGWYRTDAVIGVLFTEIPVDQIEKAQEVIGAKIRELLGRVFQAGECSRITLRFHVFPEDYDGKVAQDAFTLPFYPELLADDTSGVWSQKLKRAFDIIGSLGAMILFLPFFLIIPLAIKLTSPGPVFFRQERLGQLGRPFTFLKFRSMKVNNDDEIHRKFIKDFIADKIATNASDKGTAVYKIQSDPRLTPIGSFLRKSSLDELPQFINVLKGDMSLVGPRPPIPYEVVNYDLWHRRRVLAQKPGITGLWQVTGRSLTTFDGMVRLDLQYSRKRSLWLDIKLLLATPMAVIRGKGAY
jgi:lipopolysaccharide/colanic/teichoic acid biosynthesis glycosyltransferase